MTLYKLVKYNQERFIYIRNKCIISYGCKLSNNCAEDYIDILPGKNIFKSEVFDNILECIPKNCDHIFILRPPALGEAYVFVYLYKALLQKFKAKNPCVIVRVKAQQELLRLYNINSYYIDMNLADINRCFEQTEYSYKNRFFHIYPNTIKESFRIYREFNINYPEYLKKLYNLNEFTHNKIFFEDSVVNNINKKFQNIDRNKLIFILPEAKTIKPLNKSFWMDLIQELKDSGYIVYVNSINNPDFSNFQELSISEALYLASISKCIIGLRSGFVEPISVFNVPMHIIYTDHKYNKGVTSTDILRFSSLKYYPYAKNNIISEYDNSVCDELSIKLKIIENIKSMEANNENSCYNCI